MVMMFKIIPLMLSRSIVRSRPRIQSQKDKRRSNIFALCDGTDQTYETQT